MPASETTRTTKKTATTKKAAAAKTSASKKAATQKAVAGARARKPTKIKRLTVEDLLATSPEETLSFAEGKAKLRKLAREIEDRGGRGRTIHGEPAPGTPEDTMGRIDRGIVKPEDLP